MRHLFWTWCTICHKCFICIHQILKTLHRTYANLKLKPVWNDINPKAVTTDELFGYLHPATREWKDGEGLQDFDLMCNK